MQYRKYRSVKVSTPDGVFDSKAELGRWHDLQILQSAGVIHDLRRQVKYELIPVQKIGGKVVERAVSYIADFVYKDEDGKMVVEDVKGVRTPEYIIKRKLMLWFHGIRIKEYER